MSAAVRASCCHTGRCPVWNTSPFKFSSSRPWPWISTWDFWNTGMMCWPCIALLISCNITWGFNSRHRETYNRDWRPQMCKFITKTVYLRITQCILAPCKWRNAFETAFDSYSTALTITAPWKADPCLHECSDKSLSKFTTLYWHQ